MSTQQPPPDKFPVATLLNAPETLFSGGLAAVGAIFERQRMMSLTLPPVNWLDQPAQLDAAILKGLFRLKVR